MDEPEPVDSALMFPSGYDTLEYSWVKATTVSVRMRILFVMLQSTNNYEASPECHNMEINVVHFSENYYAILEEDAAHLNFGPHEAVFQKSRELDNHIKALYMRGHNNGKPISRMLVDGGAIVILMPYSLYKKLGGTDEELIKTNMTFSASVEVILLALCGGHPK